MHISHITHLGDTHPPSNTHFPYKQKNHESVKIMEEKHHVWGGEKKNAD